MSKAEGLTFVRTGKMTFQQYVSSQIRIRIYGEAGVVSGRLTRQRTIAGKQQEYKWRYTKFYVKKDGAWRVVMFHASEAVGLSSDITADRS
jgi:glutathione peroxidase-family protein